MPPDRIDRLYFLRLRGWWWHRHFNGAGDTRTPTLLNLVGFWLFQTPMAYVLAKVFGYGPTGVYMAIVIAESTLAIVGIFIFRRGRWKTSII